MSSSLASEPIADSLARNRSRLSSWRRRWSDTIQLVTAARARRGTSPASVKSAATRRPTRLWTTVHVIEAMG
jgi:hypothetical protein